MPAEPVSIRFVGLSDTEMKAQKERRLQMLEDIRRIEGELVADRRD